MEFCRICRLDQNESDEPLLRVCKCKGSVGKIHESCLKEWIKTLRKNNCEICGAEFHWEKGYNVPIPSRLPLIEYIKQLFINGFKKFKNTAALLLLSFTLFVVLPVSVFWINMIALRRHFIENDSYFSLDVITKGFTYGFLTYCFVKVVKMVFKPSREYLRFSPRVALNRDQQVTTFSELASSVPILLELIFGFIGVAMIVSPCIAFATKVLGRLSFKIINHFDLYIPVHYTTFGLFVLTVIAAFSTLMSRTRNGFSSTNFKKICFYFAFFCGMFFLSALLMMWFMTFTETKFIPSTFSKVVNKLYYTNRPRAFKLCLLLSVTSVYTIRLLRGLYLSLNENWAVLDWNNNTISRGIKSLIKSLFLIEVLYVTCMLVPIRIIDTFVKWKIDDFKPSEIDRICNAILPIFMSTIVKKFFYSLSIITQDAFEIIFEKVQSLLNIDYGIAKLKQFIAIPQINEQDENDNNDENGTDTEIDKNTDNEKYNNYSTVRFIAFLLLSFSGFSFATTFSIITIQFLGRIPYMLFGVIKLIPSQITLGLIFLRTILLPFGYDIFNWKKLHHNPETQNQRAQNTRQETISPSTENQDNSGNEQQTNKENKEDKEEGGEEETSNQTLVNKEEFQQKYNPKILDILSKYERLSSTLVEIESNVGIENLNDFSNNEPNVEPNSSLLFRQQHQQEQEQEEQEQQQEQEEQEKQQQSERIEQTQQQNLTNQNIDLTKDGQTMTSSQEFKTDNTEEKTLEELLDEDASTSTNTAQNTEKVPSTSVPSNDEDVQTQNNETENKIAALHNELTKRLKKLSLFCNRFYGLKECVEIASSYTALLQTRLEFLQHTMTKVESPSNNTLTKEEIDLFMKEEITQTPFPRFPAIKRRKSFTQRIREIFSWTSLLFILGFLVPIILGLTFQYLCYYNTSYMIFSLKSTILIGWCTFTTFFVVSGHYGAILLQLFEGNVHAEHIYKFFAAPMLKYSVLLFCLTKGLHFCVILTNFSNSVKSTLTAISCIIALIIEIIYSFITSKEGDIKKMLEAKIKDRIYQPTFRVVEYENDTE